MKTQFEDTNEERWIPEEDPCYNCYHEYCVCEYYDDWTNHIVHEYSENHPDIVRREMIDGKLRLVSDLPYEPFYGGYDDKSCPRCGEERWCKCENEYPYWTNKLWYFDSLVGPRVLTMVFGMNSIVRWEEQWIDDAFGESSHYETMHYSNRLLRRYEETDHGPDCETCEPTCWARERIMEIENQIYIYPETLRFN